MLVQQKTSSDESVHGPEGRWGKVYSKIRGRFDQLPVKRYWDRDSELFSPAWTPERRAEQIARHDPDIVHLHWITNGFMKPSTIAEVDAPIVWTLHDMWPFTGGCHYSKSCTKFREKCGACPHLGSNEENDLSNTVWERKKKALVNSDPFIISPSKWLAERARESSLLSEYKIDVIPNALDTDEYYPRKREEGIHNFNLEGDTNYILFGAAYDAPRKGGELLRKSLSYLEEVDDLRAVTFGNIRTHDSQFPVPVDHLGWLSEEDLRLIYSTVDVMVVPSKQEAFGQTATEALASGTPVVAYDATGLKDIVDHRETGYLADPFDPEDLAAGIQWVLSQPELNDQLSSRAWTTAQRRFAIGPVIDQHLEIYEKVQPSEGG